MFHGISRPLSTLDTQIIYCGDNLEQLPRLPSESVDLIYVDPPFNSNRVYETFWGETREKRAFEDRHESTRAYIDFMRPRCMELARVLKPGSPTTGGGAHAKAGGAMLGPPRPWEIRAAGWMVCLPLVRLRNCE
jgi:hypothetical protein